MLIFNSENIFSHDNTVDSSQIGLNALITKLLPFQLKTGVSLGSGEVTSFKLKNRDNEIDLISDISLIDILTDSQEFYYLFDGETTISTTITCGVWQVEIIANGETFYSNFFNVISDYSAILTYANTFDFDDRIYQYGYKNILYLTNKIVADAPFIVEKVLEKRNGSKVYEYQNLAESYLCSIFGDENLINELEKLPMFNLVYFTWQKFDNVQIFDRAIFEFEFDGNSLIYRGVVKFAINEIDKIQCQENGAYTPVGSTIITRTTDDGTTMRTTDDGTTERKTN